MDALLISLHALSLLPPTPSQLLQLIEEAQSSGDEETDPRALARVLSLGSYNASEDQEDDSGSFGLGLDRELIEDAVVEIIRTFRTELAKMTVAFELEQQRRASPIPLPKATPLHFLKLRHESAQRQAEKVNSLYGGYRPRLIFNGGPSYSSSKELSQLQPITDLSEVQVGCRLENKYLILRVESSVQFYVAATFIATAPLPLGWSTPVTINHFARNPSMSTEEASQLLPTGSVIAVKEPYISPNHSLLSSAGSIGIRIDSPTDVVLLSGPADRRMPAADAFETYTTGLEWPKEVKQTKGKGKKTKDGSDDDANHGQPKQASTAAAPEADDLQPLWLQDGPLSQARQMSKPESVLVERTRDLARILLKSNRPGAAWRELSASRESGAFAGLDEATRSEVCELEGDILTALSAWEEAKAAYQAASTSLERSKILSGKLTSASRRLLESQQGPNPDGSTVSAVYTAHLSSSTPRLPLADWLSPALKVQQITGAGRGLVTTRAVPAGEPLLLARSRGSSYPHDQGLEYCPILRCNLENGVMSTTTQVLATTNLIHAIVDRPELAQEILGLTAGSLPDSPWVKAAHFAKATAKIDASEAWSNVSLDRIGPIGGVNAHYIDEVLRHNAFGPGVIKRGDISTSSTNGTAPANGTAQVHSGQQRPPKALLDRLHRDPPSAFSRSTQPHPLPAILNHACLPNVSSVFFGDTLVTKALRDLAEDEEISHEYVRGGLEYQDRQASLSKHGFVCGCKLCQLDRQDGDDRLNQRRRLLAVQGPALFGRSDGLLGHREDTEANRENHQDIRTNLQDFERSFEQTYAKERGPLRPELRQTLERIARHAEREGNAATALAVS